MRVYQLKDVTLWMGHSDDVALKHYLRPRKEEFDRAVKFGAVKSANNVPGINVDTQNLGQRDFIPPKKTALKTALQASAQPCLPEQENEKSPCFTGSCGSVQVDATDDLAEAGLEPARPLQAGDFKSPASAIPPLGQCLC